MTFIAQERLLVETRSVIENVFLGVEPAWRSIVDRRRLRARYAALRERTGFDLAPHAGVRGLRAADRQKVEVMRALAREADLVIMDEPTAGLTRDEATELLDVVRLLKTQGTTVLYISHTLEEVLSVADTVSVLRAGELVRSAPTESESVGSLVTAMLGHALELTFPEKAFPAEDAPVVLSVQGPDSFWASSTTCHSTYGPERSSASPVSSAVDARRSRDSSRVPTAWMSGTVALDGEPLRLRSPRDAIRHGIVLLPESREDEGLMMRRSIVENVALPHLKAVSRAAVLRRRYEARRTAELIRRVDVRTHALTARLATLSGGNQQKVLFAKWLFRRPRVLIADEPTRGVDVGAKARAVRAHAFVRRGGGVRPAHFVRGEGGNRSRPSRARHARRPCCRRVRRSRRPERTRSCGRPSATTAREGRSERSQGSCSRRR